MPMGSPSGDNTMTPGLAPAQTLPKLSQRMPSGAERPPSGRVTCAKVRPLRKRVPSISQTLVWPESATYKRL